MNQAGGACHRLKRPEPSTKSDLPLEHSNHEFSDLLTRVLLPSREREREGGTEGERERGGEISRADLSRSLPGLGPMDGSRGFSCWRSLHSQLPSIASHHLGGGSHPAYRRRRF